MRLSICCAHPPSLADPFDLFGGYSVEVPFLLLMAGLARSQMQRCSESVVPAAQRYPRRDGLPSPTFEASDIL